MRGYVGVFGQGKKVIQRGALFFLSFVLMFGLVEPGIYQVYAESNSQKAFRTDFKLDPLASQKSAPITTLTDGASTELDRP